MNTSHNTDNQDPQHLQKLSKATSLSEILGLGGILEKAIMHEKGYIQLPTDAKGHDDLLQIINCSQWTINRGMGGMSYCLAVNEECNHEYLQDVAWLLTGLADLNSQLSSAKEQVEESQGHLLDKQAKRVASPLGERFKESILLADYVIRSALVELSELGQQSIEDLQSIPDYQQDIIQMLEGMESAKKQLDQARKASKRLIKLSAEVK